MSNHHTSENYEKAWKGFENTKENIPYWMALKGVRQNQI